MKRKLFLTIIPALLVLSACQVGAKPKENNILFQEDTLAHEEIFNNKEFSMIDNRVRKLDPLDSNFPVIGVQKSTPKTIKVEDVDTEVVSVRFVAAVNLDLEHLEDVHPVWTRILYNAAGDGTLKASDTLESTKAYTSINDGGSGILPSSFGSYNRFVTYTMTNIPTAYNSCYFNVSLSLEGVPTKVLATTVDLTSHYTFSTSAHDYFLGGTIEGDEKELQCDYPTRNSNRATFTADFEDGDAFYIFRKTDSAFKVWNSDCFGNVHGNFTAGSGKLIQYVEGGHMRLYLNNDDPDAHLYTNAFTVAGTEIYVRGDVNSWGCSTGYELKSDGGDCQGIIYDVELPVGEFKIGNSEWSKQWGFADSGKNKRIEGPVAGRFSGNYDVADQNIYCSTAGTYNIMLTNGHTIYIWEA